MSVSVGVPVADDALSLSALRDQADSLLGTLCDDLRARRSRGQPAPVEAHFVALHVLFQRQAEKALQLVDKGCIKKLVGATSGRAVFQVEGQGEVYLVYPSNLCTCMSFFFDVVTKHESHTCKHLLAVQLADALGSCTTVVMPDDHLAELLADA